MKMFVSLLCLVSLALAEPPVGDGYAAARAHDHGHHDHSSSSRTHHELSTSYGPPKTGSLSQEYGAPNLRDTLSETYGPPTRISEVYGPPTSKIHGNSGHSRSLSQEYGAPNARSELSQEYGVPAQRTSDSYHSSPSKKYGAPELRSKPAKTYLPAQSNSDSYTPTETYGAPEIKSSLPHSNISEDYSGKSSYNAKKAFKSSHTVSRTYGAPKKAPSKSYGVPSSRSLSMTFGAPNAKNSDSYSHDARDVSQTYGAPNVSESYGAPEEMSVSMEYSAPELKANANSAAPYPAARSSPPETYGVPSARDASPSDMYGAPEHGSSENQGYEYSRNSLSFEDEEEPANYEFAYAVNDEESGNEFGHKETRHENRAEGSYFVVLPDGTKQVVEYEADEQGFKPRIFLESAAEVRSAAGPY